MSQLLPETARLLYKMSGCVWCHPPKFNSGAFKICWCPTCYLWGTSFTTIDCIVVSLILTPRGGVFPLAKSSFSISHHYLPSQGHWFVCSTTPCTLNLMTPLCPTPKNASRRRRASNIWLPCESRIGSRSLYQDIRFYPSLRTPMDVVESVLSWSWWWMPLKQLLLSIAFHQYTALPRLESFSTLLFALRCWLCARLPLSSYLHSKGRGLIISDKFYVMRKTRLAFDFICNLEQCRFSHPLYKAP